MPSETSGVLYTLQALVVRIFESLCFSVIPNMDVEGQSLRQTQSKREREREMGMYFVCRHMHVPAPHGDIQMKLGLNGSQWHL